MRGPALAALLLALTAPLAAFGNDVGFGLDHKDRLTITGDADANDIEVRYDPTNNVIVIEGKNGTTVRGQPKGEVPLPADPDKITEITLESGLGDDKITIDLSGIPVSQRPDKVTVEDAGGDDTITVKNTQLSDKGTIALKPGTGNDTTVLDGCDTSNVNIRDRAGDNKITVKNCNVGGVLTIEPSSGKNTLEVMDTFYEDSVIRPKGEPGVQPSLEGRVERTAGRKVSFSGTSGPDQISFEDNTIESVSAKLGDGDDLISFTGSVIDKASVDGGAGDLDCFDDTQGGNVFGSFKEKGFEPCDNVNLAFQNGAGTNALDPETWPEEAVAWRTRNPEARHQDGPFALPGHGAALGLPERDPAMLAPPAHWGIGPECVEGPVQLQHVHDAWESHGDPDDEGCGHGFLEWGFFLPG